MQRDRAISPVETNLETAGDRMIVASTTENIYPRMIELNTGRSKEESDYKF